MLSDPEQRQLTVIESQLREDDPAAGAKGAGAVWMAAAATQSAWPPGWWCRCGTCC
jgi:hypothetical protein